MSGDRPDRRHGLDDLLDLPAVVSRIPLWVPGPTAADVGDGSANAQPIADGPGSSVIGMVCRAYLADQQRRSGQPDGPASQPGSPAQFTGDGQRLPSIGEGVADA